MGKNLTEHERLIADIEYYKHRYDDLIFLTQDEADALCDAWIMESIRRYGKYNNKAPLYLKLRKFKDNTGCSLTGKTPSLETELVVQVYPPVPL